MTAEQELNELSRKVNQGLAESYKRMVAFKKYKNSPIISYVNGEIVKINPHDID